MHNSTNTRVFLHATSDPIIEDCTDISFSSNPFITSNDTTSSLNVQDFNWLKQIQSPNWRMVENSKIDDVQNLLISGDNVVLKSVLNTKHT